MLKDVGDAIDQEVVAASEISSAVGEAGDKIGATTASAPAPGSTLDKYMVPCPSYGVSISMYPIDYYLASIQAYTEQIMNQADSDVVKASIDTCFDGELHGDWEHTFGLFSSKKSCSCLNEGAGSICAISWPGSRMRTDDWKNE